MFGLTIQSESKLGQLLRHVAAKCPFYERRLAKFPENAVVQDRMAALPIMDKRLIRECSLEFLSRDIVSTKAAQLVVCDALSDSSDWENETSIELPGGIRVFLEKTSGSTGTPLKLLKTERERLVAGKAVWKLRRRLDPSARPGKLFPFEHAPLDFAFPYDVSDFSTANVALCLAEIARRGYTWLHGHPQGLEWWADAVLADPHLGQCLRLSHVESNGSPLSPRARHKMQAAFHCAVIDNYNCREVWTIAFECADEHLHLNDDCIVAEIVDDQRMPIKLPGVPGSLVITSLYSYTMPFIRYEIGDRVMFDDCACRLVPDSPIIRFAATNRDELIAGTALAGNEVFSKVTRYIYGSFQMHYAEIRVAQTGLSEFDVWVGDFRGERSAFTAQFASTSEALLHPNSIQLHVHFVNCDAPIFRAYPRQLFVPMRLPAAS